MNIKYLVVPTTAVCALALPLTGCSKPQSQTHPSASAPASKSRLTASATLTPDPGASQTSADLDKRAKAIKSAGLLVTVDKSKQTVTFQTVDPKTGKHFKDYYKFDEKTKNFWWHKYVSAMGQEFDYKYDLASSKLKTVYDFNHKDVNKEVQKMGFWKQIISETEDAKGSLENYFSTRYGMTIEQAITAS